VPRTRLPLVDIRAKTVSAAYFSRGKYPALRASYTASGTVDVTSSVVASLTAQVLSRAVNDLADIVRAVPSGAGVSPPPATVRVDMTGHYPGWGTTGGGRATCLNARGAPISGAAVAFTWQSVAGSVTTIAYTNHHGVARDWHTVARVPLGSKVRLVAVASASGSSTVGSTWYVPTPVLAAGSRGIKATVSNVHPKRGSVVRASAVLRDTAGRPIEGLKVTFTWKYRTKKVVATYVTDAAGEVRMARNIGPATRGRRVYVTAKMTSGRDRSSTASFVPR
jgi:hypothetical protein